jgi:hypothetical protein
MIIGGDMKSPPFFLLSGVTLIAEYSGESYNLLMFVISERNDRCSRRRISRNGRLISYRNCPDWALMCKHVAAAMYGIGVRMDENPFYFFELRGIEAEKLIDVALETKVDRMLRNAEKDSDRIIKDSDLDVFGVL